MLKLKNYTVIIGTFDAVTIRATSKKSAIINARAISPECFNLARSNRQRIIARTEAEIEQARQNAQRFA